jgi:phosphoribosylglycinamide formyltransferase-1
MVKVGAVCSSGGAVLSAAYELMRDCGYDFHISVATDRECGVESVCSRLGVSCRRVEDADRNSFSCRVADWLYGDQEVQLVCLFFARLVGDALFARGPCINFHPSLLPSFPGFGALNAALESNAKFFGATAHLVDASIDAGPIVAQVVASLPHGASLQQIERVSFAQKLYLMLSLSETLFAGGLEALLSPRRIGRKVCWDDNCNPAISNQRLEDAFRSFVKEEGIPWPGCSSSER